MSKKTPASWVLNAGFVLHIIAYSDTIVDLFTCYRYRQAQCYIRLFFSPSFGLWFVMSSFWQLRSLWLHLARGSAKLFPRVSSSFFFLFNHRKPVAPMSSVDTTAHCIFTAVFDTYTPHTNVQFHVLYSSILNFDGYLSTPSVLWWDLDLIHRLAATAFPICYMCNFFHNQIRDTNYIGCNHDHRVSERGLKEILPDHVLRPHPCNPVFVLPTEKWYLFVISWRLQSCALSFFKARLLLEPFGCLSVINLSSR